MELKDKLLLCNNPKVKPFYDAIMCAAADMVEAAYEINTGAMVDFGNEAFKRGEDVGFQRGYDKAVADIAAKTAPAQPLPEVERAAAALLCDTCMGAPVCSEKKNQKPGDECTMHEPAEQSAGHGLPERAEGLASDHSTTGKPE